MRKPRPCDLAQADVVARSKGIKLGLGVNQTWVALFEQNERMFRRPRNTNYRIPYEDFELTQFMLAEFPHKASKVYSEVYTVRFRYNRGLLGCQRGVPPKNPSYRYNRFGLPVGLPHPYPVRWNPHFLEWRRKQRGR